MPLRDDWITQIKEVANDYIALRMAADHFAAAVLRDPTLARGKAPFGRIQLAMRTMEEIYLVRLFARFEAGLREYWATIKTSQPQMTGLLNGVAAKRTIVYTFLHNAHKVRELRNKYVHEGEVSERDKLKIEDCRDYLCRFFKYLPQAW